jgi:AbrB family looped-hinge helix DNA binding protein
MKVELTKISLKGQVVIPQRIREELSIEAGNRFVVYTVDGSIVFKKLDLVSSDEIGTKRRDVAQ